LQTCLTSPTPVPLSMEPYFRALLRESRDRDALGRACMALVRCNQARARVAARPFFDHLDDHPERASTTAFLNSRLDPGYTGYIRSTDPAALSDENEALLDRVIKEFGDIPLSPRWAKAKMEGRTLAEAAKRSLDAIRSVAVGRVAPEIEGEDIDGRPMRLSDYRGKVVVLVFWGTWCAPCRGLIPKEKALVERLKDRPFALLGVNSDSDRGKLRAAVAEEGISWRSWWDGGSPHGPVSNRWDVNGWPTIIVLDKAGVIRFKGLPHHVMKPLDDAVDSLLRE
jgi:thiol-disulfide isomerase/thioredoxin